LSSFTFLLAINWTELPKGREKWFFRSLNSKDLSANLLRREKLGRSRICSFVD
jgi:hypothetical protein